MAKKVLYGEEARAAVLNGGKKLYDAVRVTLSPKGRNFMIAKGYSDPVMTHDGITVANAVILSTPEEEAGAAFIRKAAAKNNLDVGDGTTTTTIVTYKLIEKFNDMLINPMQLAKQLKAEAESLCSQLKPVKVTDLAPVAIVSCADEELGSLIAAAVEKVGLEGSVVVERSDSVETTVEVVEGFKVGSGYMSPYMATDDSTGRAVHEDTSVLIVNAPIKDAAQLTAVMQHLVAKNQKSLVVVADDFSQEVVAKAALLNQQGNFGLLLVKSSGYGENRVDQLEDLSSITNATLVRKGEDIKAECLGKAEKVIADHEQTTFTGNADEKRKEIIRSQIENAKTERVKDRLRNRLANLNGKVAIVYVGGNSEAEVEEKVYRVDDAIAAARAALDEGVVPGGATAYLSLKTSDTDAGKLFAEALRAPFLQMMENAGVEGEAKLSQIKDGLGFDVMNPDEPVNLMERGIVDPVKVVKAAITTAASIAAAVITMGGLVVDVPEVKND